MDNFTWYWNTWGKEANAWTINYDLFNFLLVLISLRPTNITYFSISIWRGGTKLIQKLNLKRKNRYLYMTIKRIYVSMGISLLFFSICGFAFANVNKKVDHAMEKK